MDGAYHIYPLAKCVFRMLFRLSVYCGGFGMIIHELDGLRI